MKIKKMPNPSLKFQIYSQVDTPFGSGEVVGFDASDDEKPYLVKLHRAKSETLLSHDAFLDSLLDFGSSKSLDMDGYFFSESDLNLKRNE